MYAKNPHSKYNVERIGILLKVVFSASEIQREDKINLRLQLLPLSGLRNLQNRCQSVVASARKSGSKSKSIQSSVGRDI